MARKRSISTEVSIDKSVNRLVNECGPLAGFLYCLMIPHAEDDCTITGDYDEIKLKILPGIKIATADDIKIIIEKMIELKLIYKKNENVLSFYPTTFYKYQSYINASKRVSNDVEEYTEESDTVLNIYEKSKTIGISELQDWELQNTEKHQETPQNTEEHHKTPKNTEEHQETPQNTEEHQETPKNTEEHQETPQNTEEHQETPKNTALPSPSPSPSPSPLGVRTKKVKKTSDPAADLKIERATGVWLKDAELEKLVQTHGDSAVRWMVQKLSAYKISSGKVYVSDYGAILNWVVDKFKETHPPGNSAGGYQGNYSGNAEQPNRKYQELSMPTQSVNVPEKHDSCAGSNVSGANSVVMFGSSNDFHSKANFANG